MAVKVSDQEAAPRKRFRRPPGEGRQLLLQAAHDVFSEHGYARATTKEIAERAGVVEALLFRNFGSKAALFNEVVFGPLRAFVLQFASEHVDEESYSDEVQGREFVGRLYDLLHENRGLIITYIATIAFEPGVLDEGGTAEAFRDVLNVMDNVADSRAGFKPRTGTPSAQQRKEAEALRILERSLVGMVMSAALFGDMLFSEGRRKPKRDEIVDELTRTAAVSLRHARETLSGPSKRSAPAR
jgi:AcrR family transcriptional regulator